ncbi:MAG: hypothetical protein WHT27_07350 [candidate division WOR-3 bacterium]
MKTKVKNLFIFFFIVSILIIFSIVILLNFRWLNRHLSIIKEILIILQILTIIIISIFSAWWTYKTFGEKERREEIRKIKKTLIKTYQNVAEYLEKTKMVDENIRKKVEFQFKCLFELYNLFIPLRIELETAVYLDKNKKEKLKKDLLKNDFYEKIVDEYIVLQTKDIKVKINPLSTKFEEWSYFGDGA